MSEDLQRVPPIAVDWKPEKPKPQLAVELLINVPDYATVKRHSITGQLMISDIQIPDLIGLRDALTEQIAHLQEQERNGWELL